MNKKIKVFYLANWYNSIYNNIFNNLDKDIDITMLLSSHFPNYKGNKYKVKVLSTWDLGNFFYFFQKNRNRFILFYKKELKEMLLKERPDVVAVNLAYLPSTYQLYRWCKKLNIRFVLQTEMKKFPKNIIEKNLFKVYAFFFIRPMLKYSNKVIAWCNDSKNFFIEYFKVSEDKIDVLLPSVDTKLFYPCKVRRDEKKLSILMIARFVDYKNHSDLLYALKLLEDKGVSNIEVNFLDKGPNLDKIKSLAVSLNVDHKVSFIERVPHDEVLSVISKNDIFVLPSYNEAIGIVIIEAMACGLPIVVSDTCGGKDYVLDEKCGYIFKTGNVEDLANKILKLMDKKRVREFGKIAQLRSREFTTEKVGKRFGDLIKND